MQFKPRDRKRVMLTGVFIAFSLLIGSISVFMLSKESSLFATKIIVKTKVKNAQNLRAGSSVKLKGIKVGSVHNVVINSIDSITVNLEIIKKYSKWIKQDSKIVFKTQGVLGDRFLEIVGGSEEAKPIAHKMFLEIDESSQIDRFINKGEDILIVGSRVLQRIDHLLNIVDESNFKATMTNINTITKNTADLTNSLRPKDTGKSIGTSLEKMSLILSRIEKGPGSLNSLIYDRSVHDDLKEILGGTRRSKVLRYFIREQIKDK